MMVFFFMYIVIVFCNVNIDEINIIEIQPKTSLFIIKTSSPGTGFVWYLLSENESKVKVEDVDGVYTSGKPGYQNFTISCSNQCKSGDNLKLSLILKRPWENNLSVIRSIDLKVVD